MWPALIPMLGSLMDRLFPDPKAAADAKLQIMQMAQTGELAQLDSTTKLALAQTEVNKVEAASQSIFVAGWRPAVGWCCCGAFAFKFVILPTAMLALSATGHTVTMPAMDFTEMSTILMGMLGLGAMRTVEKVKGVA